jgi:hypothetical protein
MRERHFPRLCRTCEAPMARQEETCWRCGTQWASEDAPRTRLRVIHGGSAGADRGDERAAIQARIDIDRWVAEGGSVPLEAAVVRPAATTHRR